MNEGKNQKADWLAWSLQFFAGSIIGLFLGYAVAGRKRYYAVSLLAPDDIMPFALGAALLGGALASHYGDRLWMEDRVFPNDPVQQSQFSFSCSVTIGFVGVGLMGCAMLRTLGWIGR